MPETSCVCQEDKHVVLDVNGEHQSLVKLKQGIKQRIHKSATCSLDPLLGSSYGSLFDVVGNGFEARLEKRQRICETAGESWESVLEVRGNNSGLNDAGEANQALTTDDIQRLREEGKSGDEIVAALTANSATFANKTQYSQDKYKKKKAKKYLQCVTLIRPCARSLADYWFQKQPQKIWGLRSDSLAILLSLANIGSNSRTIVVDGIGGLIAGAAIERMGGKGHVVNAYAGDKKPSQDIASCFNFPADFIKAMPVSLATLRDYMQQPQTGAIEDAEMEDVEPAKSVITKKERKSDAVEIEDVETIDSVITKKESSTDAADQATGHKGQAIGSAEPDTKRQKLLNGEAQPGVKEEAQAERYEIAEKRKQEMCELCKQGFQSCLIACPSADPTATVNAVMPMLAPSASFAIYHPSAEPLADYLESLKATKSAICLQLQESWWREYQVLPGRTHPTMATSGTGGYLLSGIKIVCG